MPPPLPTQEPVARTLRWPVLAGLLILAVSCCRVANLAWDCPLDLAPDEAHYWDWSRHLDWSYYSKGPVVAYLIRLTGLAGSGLRLPPGGATLAVRLPAVLCGALLLASLYVLTVQVYGRQRLAAAVVAVALTLPPVAAGSSLMTVDAPYTCCWGWALVLGHRAVFRDSWWAWPATGAVVGLGILAKYTMFLWVPSLCLFLALSADRRRLMLCPRFWLMLGVALVCCLPVLVWNARHGWVSLRHVLGQAGFSPADAGVRWFGPLAYLGVQCALLLGFWFVAWLTAVIAWRPWQTAHAGTQYLWWMSAPVFLVFAGFSLKTAEEPNWPVTAYLSGLVLTLAWLAARLRSPDRGVGTVTAVGVAGACGLGLVLVVLMHRGAWARPILLRLSGPPTETCPLPLRRFDPTCRLRGWRSLAAEVDRVRSQVGTAGIEPVLAASGWTLPGELGFYCAGQPTVFSLGLALGDRHSQYDLWRPNPVADADRFRGRTVIFVGDVSPALRQAFARLEPTRLVTYREQGQPIAQWMITVCHGFQGFPRAPAEGPRF
ncbi:MAG TPA: glycosyltransferase family 39 protein [Gemmataceae bacterium]|nr:glycosyltransferase family 39 protein [Gemmataceae bacterium]